MRVTAASERAMPIPSDVGTVLMVLLNTKYLLILRRKKIGAKT